MKHLTSAIVLLGMLLAYKTDLLACSCGRLSVKDAYSDSEAVFLGKVIDVRKNVGSIGRWLYEMNYHWKGGAFDDSVYYMSVTFSVTKIWKGTPASSVVIQTPDASVCCICGYDFVPGKSYLVYAYGPGLHTNICTRTTSEAEALSDISELDLLTKSTTKK